VSDPLPPFQRFLDAYRGEVWRLICASVPASEADDCFQETFIAALRAYPRLRRGSDLRAWVLTIAHRKALDAHRARARRPVAVGVVADERAVEPARAAPEDPVWEAVRALPPGQRAAVTLRFAGDLRPAEVAAALGIEEAAARRRLSDGLSKLREEYRP
jgi:RNA polymerase sigma factor (sigma-70 family)